MEIPPAYETENGQKNKKQSQTRTRHALLNSKRAHHTLEQQRRELQLFGPTVDIRSRTAARSDANEATLTATHAQRKRVPPMSCPRGTPTRNISLVAAEMRNER